MSFRSLMLAFALCCAVLAPAARADDTARADLLALWQKMFATRDLAFSADIVSIDKKGRETRSQPKEISVLREHRAALEFPTSTLQPIKIDKGRITTV